MAKLIINLLPPEIIAQEIKKAKFYRIQFLGIMIILIMVFLASATFALRILQNRNIVRIQADLSQQEQKVLNLKSTQASLLLLRNRLELISKYLGIPSKQSSLYELINKLIPPSVVVSSIEINKSGEIAFIASVPDPVSLDRMVNNLTTNDQNEGKITQVSIQSLSRGREGLYRISFKIAAK